MIIGKKAKMQYYDKISQLELDLTFFNQRKECSILHFLK